LIDSSALQPSEIISRPIETRQRYLIGPSRVTSNGKEQRYGIASGLLSGFGGFVARLSAIMITSSGAATVNAFCRRTFALPADNDIIKSWPASVDKNRIQGHTNGRRQKAQRPEAIASFLCAAPLKGSRAAAWPRLSQAVSTHCKTRIAERFDGVSPRLLAQNLTGLLWILLSLAVRPFPPASASSAQSAKLRASLHSS